MSKKLVTYVNRVHLIYLGLLPSLATLAVLRIYGHPQPFLLFVCGVAAVSVYLAVIYSYARLPETLPLSLLVLLDGPLFALVSWASGQGAWPLFAVEGFLVDGIAVWLAILGLSLVSPEPTPEQRVATVGIMLAALGITLSLFWPYVRDVLWGQWFQVSWLAGGVAEGIFVWGRLLNAQALARKDEDAAGLYIAILVMVWVGCMIAGNVWHEVALQ